MLAAPIAAAWEGGGPGGGGGGALCMRACPDLFACWAEGLGRLAVVVVASFVGALQQKADALSIRQCMSQAMTAWLGWTSRSWQNGNAVCCNASQEVANWSLEWVHTLAV